jgi:hypothetical protein
MQSYEKQRYSYLISLSTAEVNPGFFCVHESHPHSLATAHGNSSFLPCLTSRNQLLQNNIVFTVRLKLSHCCHDHIVITTSLSRSQCYHDQFWHIIAVTIPLSSRSHYSQAHHVIMFSLPGTLGDQSPILHNLFVVTIQMPSLLGKQTGLDSTPCTIPRRQNMST